MTPEKEDKLPSAEDEFDYEAESGDPSAEPGDDALDPVDPQDDPDLLDDEDDEEPGGNMSLLEHLGELRVRLTRCAMFVGIGFLPGYYYAELLFNILMKPMMDVWKKLGAQHSMLPEGFFDQLTVSLKAVLAAQGFQYTDKMDVFMKALQESLMRVVQEGHFQYTYPAEAFFAHVKIALVASFFLMSPFIFAQIWGFIAPGLYSHERRWVVPAAIVSSIFFVSGALFGYFVVFPVGFEFFAGFSTETIRFTPKLSEYLSFCLKLLIAFGIAFELPLFILVLARIGLVNARKLRKFQPYSILVSFIAAAILTPPDPASQIMMAGPLILLYELGIWLAYAFGKKDKKEKDGDETEGEGA